MNILIIITKAGLCNRLQEILSYREYGLSLNFDKIYFIWFNTSHCTGNINELIEDIPNITFLTYDRSKKLDTQILEDYIMSNILIWGNGSDRYYQKKNIIFNNQEINIEMRGGSGKDPKYQLINPEIIVFNKNLLEKANEIITNTLNNKYIAIHLRNQDNVLNIDYNFINNLLDKYCNEYNIYLATDDIKLQDVYIKKYKNLFFNSNILESWHTNRSNIKPAIIDLLICSKANIFCGTPNKNDNIQSSFSNFIYGLRGHYDIAILKEYYNKHYISCL